jgi:hypothetical protein
VFTAIVWLRWRDGQVIEAWNEFDAASVMAQITPTGPSAAGAAVAMPTVKPV